MKVECVPLMDGLNLINCFKAHLSAKNIVRQYSINVWKKCKYNYIIIDDWPPHCKSKMPPPTVNDVKIIAFN